MQQGSGSMSKTFEKVMVFICAACAGFDFASMIENVRSNNALFAVIDVFVMVWVSLSAVYYLKNL